MTSNKDLEWSSIGLNDEMNDCKKSSNWQTLSFKMPSEPQQMPDFEERVRSGRKSQESSTSDGDSGVGNESPVPR